MLPRYPGQPLQCAVVGIEPSTGRVRTLYGGKGSTPTGFNRATQARRQAGSAYKPLVFAAAFSQRDASGQPRYTPADAFINTLRDFKTPTGVWRPRNVCSEYTPTACLAYALVWSQNIATATLLEQLGIDPFLDFVQAIGLDTSGYPHELGLALGQAEVTAEEMARFAAMLANGGLRVDFHPVEIALDAAGRLRFERPEPGPRVMREVDAALLRILMQQVVAMGTGGRVRGAGAHPGYAGEIFGKTGTTDDEKDLWFVGGTPNLAGALWLGYDEPLRIGATGADLTAPMFGWWQRAAHVGLPQPPFKKYDEIEIRPVCNLSGKRPGPRCLVTQTPLLKGTGPREACTLPHEEILDPADFEGMPEVEGAYVPATPSGRRPGLPPEAALGSKKYHTIWNRGEEKAGAPEPGGTTPDGLP
jgi:membrane peptidoglycan carboxypeptidase